MFNILSFITDQKLSFVFLAAHLGPVFLREYALISYTKTGSLASFAHFLKALSRVGGRRLLVDKPTNIYARKKNVILH